MRDLIEDALLHFSIPILCLISIIAILIFYPKKEETTPREAAQRGSLLVGVDPRGVECLRGEFFHWTCWDMRGGNMFGCDERASRCFLFDSRTLTKMCR